MKLYARLRVDKIVPLGEVPDLEFEMSGKPGKEVAKATNEPAVMKARIAKSKQAEKMIRDAVKNDEYAEGIVVEVFGE